MGRAETALHQRISGAVRLLTQQIYAGLDINDPAVAHRVLSTVTARANVLLAR